MGTSGEAAGEAAEPARRPTLQEVEVRRALKLEVAAELGLLATIEEHGWGGLSSADSGRIGARMAQLLRQRSTKGGDADPTVEGASD